MPIRKKPTGVDFVGIINVTTPHMGLVKKFYRPSYDAMLRPRYAWDVQVNANAATETLNFALTHKEHLQKALEARYPGTTWTLVDRGDRIYYHDEPPGVDWENLLEWVVLSNDPEIDEEKMMRDPLCMGATWIGNNT